MQLSFDEIGSILSFCDKSVIIIFFKNYTLLNFSYTVLSNTRLLSDAILKSRQDNYNINCCDISEIDILNEVIDVDGFGNGLEFQDDIFYDGRLESIFTVDGFVLPKRIGRIWLGKSYEFYASFSISTLINHTILPWLKKRYDNFMNLTMTQDLYIDLIHNTIANSEEICSYKKLSKILRYLNSLEKYLKNIKSMQLLTRDKRKIRKICRFIGCEYSTRYPLYAAVSEELLEN